MASHQQMTFAAPWSNSIELPNGKWATVAWTKEAMEKYKSLGGWFKMNNGVPDNRYRLSPIDFPPGKSRGGITAKARAENVAIKLARKLTPSERILLLATLSSGGRPEGDLARGEVGHA